MVETNLLLLGAGVFGLSVACWQHILNNFKYVGVQGFIATAIQNKFKYAFICLVALPAAVVLYLPMRLLRWQGKLK